MKKVRVLITIGCLCISGVTVSGPLITTKEQALEILRLSHAADKDDIKQQCRKLRKLYHPDASKTNDTQEQFIKVSDACDYLADPQEYARKNNSPLSEELRDQIIAGLRDAQSKLRLGFSTLLEQFATVTAHTEAGSLVKEMIKGAITIEENNILFMRKSLYDDFISKGWQEDFVTYIDPVLHEIENEFQDFKQQVQKLPLFAHEDLFFNTEREVKHEDDTEPSNQVPSSARILMLNLLNMAHKALKEFFDTHQQDIAKIELKLNQLYEEARTTPWYNRLELKHLVVDTFFVSLADNSTQNRRQLNEAKNGYQNLVNSVNATGLKDDAEIKTVLARIDSLLKEIEISMDRWESKINRMRVLILNELKETAQNTLRRDQNQQDFGMNSFESASFSSASSSASLDEEQEVKKSNKPRRRVRLNVMKFFN